MFDLSIPNETPGRCAKCSGSGEYRWGGTVNGRSRFTGTCNACRGTGEQSAADIRRNHAFNRHQIGRVL
jgi:DnaJ-class molecular chaperone